jgi:uncharacterized phage infection (PIP) family protein YhgE
MRSEHAPQERNDAELHSMIDRARGGVVEGCVSAERLLSALAEGSERLKDLLGEYTQISQQLVSELRTLRPEDVPGWRSREN